MPVLKWIVYLVGVLALCLLIWFVGPLVAVAEHRVLAGTGIRVGLMIMLLLGWAMALLVSQWLARRRSHALAQGLAQQASQQAVQPGMQDGAGESELAILNSRFREALDIVRRSSGGRKRYGDQYLYELPWYLLIGPPGSGKTTALVNSGLNFPLEEQFGRGAVKGVGGTRHCDWWFTDQAVLIDTAGRYTTQDSHSSADSQAWHGFIGLLKKYRRRRPINGVLIALGLDELQRQTESEFISNVNAIRARLQELTDQLGVHFPVYLLLTKCDRLPGFNPYFEMMGKEERAQVWGMTFPEQLPPLQTFQQLFEAEFGQLAQRLNDNLLNRFHHERDARRRAEILAFPSAFEQTKPSLADFIGRTFSESRFHDRFQLRGVYFTSGTQDGVGMQRLLHNVAGRMGVQPQALVGTNAGTGRSFFLRNLFQQIIFPEAELVGVNRRHERQLRWLQNLGYLATLGSAVGMAVLWSTSYGLNDARLRRGDAHITEYLAQRETIKSGDALPEQVLPAFAPLLALRDTFNEPGADWLGIDWKVGFGLNQSDTVLASADRAHQQLLRGDFFQSLQNQLGAQLRQHQDEPEYLHQALKAYLMLSLPERLDKEFVRAWLQADWENRFAQQPAQVQALNQHLDELMAQDWAVQAVDEKLVEDTRRILRQIPPARQIYLAIRDQAKQQHAEDYRFDTVIGPGIRTVFDGEFVPVPWLYTQQGYHEFFKPQQENIIEQLAEDSWVVGARNQDMSELDLATVQAQVEKAYLDDYVGYWNSALSRLRFRQAGSLEEQVRLLNDLVSGNSPLRRVVEDVSVHTRLAKPALDVAAVTEKTQSAGKLVGAVNSSAGSAIDRSTQRLARISALASRNRLLNLPENPATLVDRRFAALHDWISTKPNVPAPAERLFASLGELQRFLEGATSSGSPQQASYDLATGRMANGRADPIGNLKIEARQLPQPVQQWISSLVDRAWGQVLGGARSQMVAEYQNQVVPFYESSLAGRYPFHKQSQVEVTLADFTEFFKPGGVQDTFFKQYVAPFVDTRRSPWRSQAVDGQGLGISAATLARFEQAERIRKVFFGKGEIPQIDFRLTATYLDANINRFEFDMLGERLENRHGPARQADIRWPSANGQNRVAYVFEDHYGVQYSDQVQGEWALFRFLDRHSLGRTNYGDRFNLTVKNQERKAAYELQAASAQNPFAQDVLGQFELPRNL